MRITQIISLLSFALLAVPCYGQWAGREKQFAAVEKTFGDPPGMTRLDPVSRVWADAKNKRIVVDGYIALRGGPLEMLACPVGTKEHESIIAVFSKAHIIHAGLLAVGAETGSPVKWDPEYAAPTGSEIQVFALWKDEDGKKQTVDTRKWVHVVGTKDQTLDVNFVFAGSGFWKDPDTGKKEYLAESGDLICVSNFSTATLDVPMESSMANSGLMFDTFTERIPDKDTPVRIVLQVVDAKQAAKTRDKLAANPENPLTTPVEPQPSESEITEAKKQESKLLELIGEPREP